jgi:DNA-binding CsgD family transcriptional regulator
MRGRDEEMTVLANLLTDARSSSRLLAIVADAGQGKTTLLDAVVDRAAAEGTRVLTASGIEAEADLPFAGLHQLLAPTLGYAEHLPGPQRAALDAAFGVSEAARPERFLVGLALLTLLSEIAEERPLLVAIDDVRWLDLGSMDAIAFASRRVHAEPIAIIVTARPDQDLAAFGPHLTRLNVESLDSSEAGMLVDETAPGLPQRLRTRILDEAAGNPLALVEFARARAKSGPAADDVVTLPPTDRLERLFADRLAAMPGATQQALLIAAAADSAETAVVLRATAAMGLPPDSFAPAEHDGLIAIGAQVFRFRHPILRSVIYHTAPQVDRREAHYALAKALESSPERSAWHRATVASEPDETIATALERAADRARTRAGFGAASTAMRRAADLSPRVEDQARRLTAAVALAFTAGESSTVLELERELRTLTTDPVTLGQAALWVAQVEVLHGTGKTSTSLSIPAMQSLLPTDPASAIGLMAVAAGYAFLEGDRATAAALDPLIKAIPGDGDEPWRLYVLAAVDPVGNAALVRPHVEAMIRDTAAPEALLRVTSHIPWYLDDAAAATTLLTRYTELARSEGEMGALASYVVPLALADVWQGRLSDALMHAAEGVRVALEVDQPAMAAVGIGVDSLVAAYRGERVTLQRHANGLGTAAGGLARALVCWAQGLDALASGRPDVAYAYVRRLFDPDDPASHREVARWAIADLIEAGVGAGTAEELEGRLLEAARLAVMSGGTRATLVARRARAVLMDGPTAESFETALGVQGAIGWPFELARTRLAYGSWLRRHRRIVDAREPLRSAAATFEQLGADPWEARAKAELRAAGEASTVRLKAYDDQLTPQQRQVAQLAARGLSNREIGAQLYLSPRTISFHLYNIYPKLGITTRSQLAAALGTELVDRDAAAASPV